MKASAAAIILGTGAAAAALSGLYAFTRPPTPLMAPADAALQRRAASLRNSTPEAAASLAKRQDRIIAGLAGAGACDAWIAALGDDWIVRTRSAEPADGIEIRRYGLARRHPALGSWPGIIGTIRSLGARPGVSVDGVAFTAGPEGSDSFDQADVSLSVRLRPSALSADASSPGRPRRRRTSRPSR